MKILIVTQYFWPENFKITDLAKGLAKLGHEITVLTGKPNYPSGQFFSGYRLLGIQEEQHESISIIRAPLIPRGKDSNLRLALNYLSFVVTATIVGKLKSLKPEVIFVYGPSPITVCLPAIFLKKQNIPLLFWVQDLWPESVASVNAITNQWILKVLHKLVSFIYKHCDYILASSSAYFPSIQKHHVPPEKIRYFPQTAETCYRPLPACSAPKENADLPQGFRILFSGNLGIAQDLALIIKAADYLKLEPEIKWIFIGDGSQRAWLEEEIRKRQLSDTVFWLGSFPSEKMPYFFSVIDSLLISLKQDDLFALTVPGKLQSYLACAKPIIAVLQGEGRRILEETQAGLVTSNHSVEALVETVLKMKNLSPDHRKEMGLKGQRYFETHFHRDKLLTNLEQWMYDLMEKKQ